MMPIVARPCVVPARTARFIRPGSPAPMVLLLVAAVTFISTLPGCGNCTRQGMTIAADARTTTITAPPGGGSRSILEVTGHGFNPGTAMILYFRNYPAQDPSRTEFQESTTTDSAGAFIWNKDIFQLPQRSFTSDADVDVWITAKEQPNGCTAATSIKTGKILNPPLH